MNTDCSVQLPELAIGNDWNFAPGKQHVPAELIFSKEALTKCAEEAEHGLVVAPVKLRN
jgi:hypothetical protein